MYQVICKPEKCAMPQCDGVYAEDKERGTVNGKAVYINTERQMILAGLPQTGWCITALQYWPEIRDKQGNFGGFHSGGSIEPDLGFWDKFIVKEIEAFNISLLSEGDNKYECCGDYVCDSNKGLINRKPVYVNTKKNKFMAAQETNSWVITGLNYFQEVKSKQGNFGGFDFGGGNEPDENEWRNHLITRKGTKAKTTKKLVNAASWRRVDNTSVTYKACGNSGVVRTECDFDAIRRRCLDLNCGGFTWRKPHFNQFGEEDDPPICFFFRKTQCELRNSMQRNDKFDLFIASDDFCPDCSFKPGQEAAPSCHVQWNVDTMVHGFACQVIVPQASQFTYYCVCGFDGGYCGIQQHDETKQQLLFSLWNHPSADEKVRCPSTCSGVIAQPFGGEGKGMQAFATTGAAGKDTDTSIAKWYTNVPYTFVVRTYPLPEGTEYRCDVHKPESGWQELAKYVRPEPPGSKRGHLSGLYSFIEDFSGNSIRRSANYSAWVQETAGASWRPVTRVTGTSTVEDDVPNKCVRIIRDQQSAQRVEMITGGDSLPDWTLYRGPIEPPDVPNILYQL